MDIVTGLKKVRRTVASFSLATLVASFFAIGVAQAQTFPDVNPTDWFYNYVEDLVALGVVNGDMPAYRPADLVNRAEMAKLVVEAFDLPLENPATATFSDVAPSAWYYSYVETAVKNGVVGGYKNEEGTLTGYYGPADPLTREQAAKMIVLGAPLTSNTSCGPSFPDVGVTSWSYEFVETLYAWSVIDGYPDGSYGPDRNINRAEIAKIVSNGMNPMLRPCGGFNLDSATALSATTVEACFSQDYDETSAMMVENYMIEDLDGVALDVTDVEASSDPMCVVLTTDAQEAQLNYELTVADITSADAMALGESMVSFTGYSLMTDGGDLTVQLSVDTPESMDVPSNSTRVDFASFDFGAAGDPVVLDQLTVKRVGVGEYNDITNVYLYEGNTRLTNSRTISSDTHEVEFSGLNLTIDANSTRTLTVVGTIGTNKTGSHAFEITDADAILSNASSVDGDFPLTGNMMDIKSTSAGTVVIQPQGVMGNPVIGDLGVAVAQFKLTTASEDGYLESVTLKQDGNIDTSLLSNFTMMEGVTDVPVTYTTNGRLVTLSLVTPLKLVNGSSKNFAVKADIDTATEAGDTIVFYVNNSADVYVTSVNYGVGMAATITAYDTAAESQTLTVQGGGVTISNMSSPAHDVKTNSTSVELMKVGIKASVDTVEIQKMTLGLTTVKVASGGDDYGTYWDADDDSDYDAGETLLIKNIKIKDAVTGQTLGASKQVTDATGYLATDDVDVALSFQYDDYFNIAKGTTREIIVVADIDSNQTDGVVYRASLDFTAANFTVKDSNDTAITDVVPASVVSGTNLTTRTSSLTISRAASPETRTVVKGTEVDALGMIFATGTGEGNDVKVSSITLNTYVDSDIVTDVNDFTTPNDTEDGTVTAQQLVTEVNLYVDGELIAGPVAVDATGKAIFTTNKFVGGFYVIPAGTNKTIIAKAKVSNTAVPAGVEDDAFAFTLAAADVTVYDDNGTVTPTVTGTNVNHTTTPPVYIRVTGSGTITTAVNSGRPDSSVLLAGATDEQEVTRVQLSPTKEDFSIDKLTVQVNEAGSYDDVEYVKLYKTDGTALSSNVGLDSAGKATFTGLTISAPKQTDTVIVVKAKIASILERTVATDGTAGSGADTGDALTFALSTAANDFHAVGLSSGSVDTVADASVGQTMVVRKTRPIVTVDPLPSTTLGNGTKTLLRFSVTANANGDMSLIGLKPTVTLNDGGGAALAITAASVIAYDVTGGTETQLNAVGVNSGAFISFDTARDISAGQTRTFEVRAAITGADTSGESIETKLTKDSAALSGGTVAGTETANGGGVNDARSDAANNFVWSDRSADTHAVTSTEWTNSFILPSWPSAIANLSKA